MSVDQTALYNQALNAVGSRNDISLPSESSREAEVCNLWFEPIRDQVLASARWPEATKMSRLALLNEKSGDTWEQGEARPGYRYAYALPSDALRPQFLTSFERFIVMAYGEDNKSLMTNADEAILVYSFRQEKITLWSAELRMAIAYGLAANICVPLTGKSSRAEILLNQANSLIIAAREAAANTDNEVFEVLPDWIAARGFSDTAPSRFVYPTGSLLTIANVAAGVS